MSAQLSTRYLACRSNQVPEAGRLIVDVGEKTIGIFRLEGRLYAYENVCAHQGGPVCQGLMIPRVRERLDRNQATIGYAFDEHEMHIVCPWHGFEYNIRTGEHPAKASIRLIAVPISEQDGAIYVEL